MSALTATLSANSADSSLRALEAVLAPNLATWHSSDYAIERRDAQRLPLGQDICFIGLNDQFQVTTAPLLMEGRDVSGQGLSFMHSQPITTRFAAVSFRVATGIETAIVKLSWCRFSRPGQYLSGGKFVKHRPAMQVPSDWSDLARG